MAGSKSRLAHNSYGKSRVRVLKVARDANQHTLHELTVDVALEGQFIDAHTQGDNRLVLPTDTMKNTVYALASKDDLASIESFAKRLGEHFVRNNRHITSATVTVASHPWRRAACRGNPHSHTFMQRGGERSVCSARCTNQGASMRSGLQDLLILKTTDSGFCDFLRDDYTTLRDADDRILGTSLTAWWDYHGVEHDWNACRQSIVTALIETFCEHKSLSVQHTLYAMGEAALEACGNIQRIRISMPNKHCLLVDLSPFGLDNDNEIFMPIEEPHGLIEGTIERA